MERGRQPSQATMVEHLQQLSSSEIAQIGQSKLHLTKANDSKENFNYNVNWSVKTNLKAPSTEEASLNKTIITRKGSFTENRKASIPPPLPPRKNSPLPKGVHFGGSLNPNSAGSNVKLLWKAEELGRVHYAALHVPWSFVGILRDAAIEGDQQAGYMLVKLEQLKTDDGTSLFPEDFVLTFAEVFKSLFVPLVHEQFNLKGESPCQLPTDVAEGFKLLVLSERLMANLKQSIYDHMCKMIDEEAAIETQPEGICFQVVRISIDFSTDTGRTNLQTDLMKHAITALVSHVPKSLPALECLLRESCLQRRSDIAVLLFQKVNTYMMSIIDTKESDLRALTKVELAELSSEPITKSQIDPEVSPSICINNRWDGLTANQVAQAGAGFHQGIMLEKLVNGVSKGKRVVWCSKNLLLWKKPHKIGLIQTAKSIKREHILDISLEANDGTTRTFRLRTNPNDYCIDFRARDPQSALACVSALHVWVGRIAAMSTEECPRSNSSSFLPPPPPPKESPGFERAFVHKFVRRKRRGSTSQSTSVILPIPSFLSIKSRNPTSGLL